MKIFTVLLFAAMMTLSSLTIAVASDPLAAWKPGFDPSGAKYTYILSNVTHPAVEGAAVGYRIRDKVWEATNGQVYVDFRPLSQLGGEKDVISKLKLEARAKNTITASDVLLAEIDSIEKQQFSIDNQELYDDIIAIAVPIKDKRGRFYSSLAIQAPVSRLSIHQSDRYLPLLREAADNLAMLAEDD